MKKVTTTREKILKLVESAMLAALGVVFMLIVKFPLLPSASFLEFDMGDMPIIISTLLFGPATGLISLAIVAVIQGLTVSAASGWIGMIMHFIASGAYLLIASLIYKKKKSVSGLIIALISGSLVMTALMIPLNLFLTPIYLGAPREAVLQLMLPAIIPFNLLKGMINSVVAGLVFVPLHRILDKSHLLPTNNS